MEKSEKKESEQITETMKKGAPGNWLSRREVAEIFQVSPSTVTRWAREGRVPARRTPGGHYRYPADEVRRVAGTSDPGSLVQLD
jgi:excisionase family DNA binding protein